MKVKANIVIRYKGKDYQPGQEFDVTKEIAEELVIAGYAEALEEDAKPTKRKRSEGAVSTTAN